MTIVFTRSCRQLTLLLVAAIIILQITIFLIMDKHLSKTVLHKFTFWKNDKWIRTVEMDIYNSYLHAIPYHFTFEMGDLRRDFKINANGSDVIIFLRVQKTGTMTLSNYLQDFINVSPWCMCLQTDKRCECNTIWTELLGVHGASLTDNGNSALCNCSQDEACPCQHSKNINLNQYSVVNLYKNLVQMSSKQLIDNPSRTNQGNLSNTLYGNHGTNHQVNMTSWCNCSGSDQNCACYKAWKNKVLFQGYGYNWPCGIHADWTYLHTCVEDVMKKRIGQHKHQRHMYITMVRDPFERYVSEWLFVNWTGVYFDYSFPCEDRRGTQQEVPSCPRFLREKGLTLEDFMSCESNQAVNRQTRMLADLNAIHCFTKTKISDVEKHYKMLESAMDNLRSMAFFGLTKHQELTQILFEHTFNIMFRVPFKTLPQKAGEEREIPESIRQRIIHMNHFDVMLFQYAEDLFRQRIFLLIKETRDENLRHRMQKLIQPLMKYK